MYDTFMALRSHFGSRQRYLPFPTAPGYGHTFALGQSCARPPWLRAGCGCGYSPCCRLPTRPSLPLRSLMEDFRWLLCDTSYEVELGRLLAARGALGRGKELWQWCSLAVVSCENSSARAHTLQKFVQQNAPSTCRMTWKLTAATHRAKVW